ncbi:MAG: hypothetical protein ACRDLV_11895, partial [Solirubrobacteraceae bacterium]
MGSGRLDGARRFLGALVLVGAVLGASAGGATAASSTLTATCSTFGSVLSGASSGDTIVLTGMCPSPDNSFTLPGVTGLTIEGASSGTNGFDGTGASSGALSGNSINGLTLSGLTFENYTHGAVSISDQTGTVSAPFVFDHDAFATDGDPGQQVGGLSLVLAPATCSFGSAPDVTLTSSTFTNDTAKTGAGAYIDLECPASGSSHVAATVADDTFTGDSASQTGFAGGGGLAIGAIGVDQPAVPIDLDQRSNLFENDSVTGTGTQLAGGGEYTAGANLTSLDDRFIDDTLSGPTASGEWSWGAGLATFGGGECINSASVSSTLANAIVAGNSIGVPVSPATGADAVGAGIYAGCTPTVDSVGYHLTTIDSTVSGN